ncbi:hypothetical protein [Luteipulveratus mongoliensis]|uniref:Uncharacterized protein n=1 Tax=Luteipulveratus mongoliensis TaxID=571913 RepID=A0A0K1JN04_9MICO|nr:hypothetical protein [Luteipulveratus mongoliensis]AKU17960.1 hypothetical protein VV02_22340 [Luteipulveratus mongoliensis]
MGGGIGMLVFGSILTFAVRWEPKGFDIQTTGVILMLAGSAVIAVNYYGRHRRRTTVTETYDEDDEGHEIHRTVYDESDEDSTT